MQKTAININVICVDSCDFIHFLSKETDSQSAMENLTKTNWLIELDEIRIELKQTESNRTKTTDDSEGTIPNAITFVKRKCIHFKIAHS